MNRLNLIFIIFILFILLIIRFIYFYRSLPAYHDQQHVQFTATLSEEPTLVLGKQHFTVQTPDGLPVTVMTGSSPMLHFGDKIFIDGVFTLRHFQNHSYWALYFPKLQIAKNEQNIVTKAATGIRNKAKKLYEGTLPPVSASLLLGIVFGGKQGMPDDFLKKLRTVGVLHVVAASGMNVSFVAGALLYMLGTIMKRQFALTLAILGIVFYAFVAGFEASIVRATIMSILAFSASLLGRQSAGFVTLIFTGYIMVFFSPSLFSDVGFKLSFLSTAGILLIKPVFKIKKIRGLRLIGEDVGTTVSAQLATIPIMFGVFGNYGVLSVLVNALVLWTVPILMVLGSLALFAGVTFEPAGKLVLFLSYPFLLFFETVVSFFGGTGWMIRVDSFPLALGVGYYLLLAALIIFLKKRKTQKQKNKQILSRT